MFREFLAAGLILVGSNAAYAESADQMRAFKVGNWTAGSYSRNGVFNYCAANASYKSGVVVLFSVTREYNWSIGFASSQWSYTPGAQIRITFAIDDSEPMTAVGMARSARMVEIPLQASGRLFNLFRKGRLLRVGGSQRPFEFYLTGTDALLTSLLECVKRKGAAPEPIEVGIKPSNPTPAPQGLQYSSEALAFAANLLSAANVTGYRILGPTESPEIKAHARWIVTGSTFGTVDIRPSIETGDIKMLPSELIANDARTCKGAFLSGSLPNDKDENIARAFSTCDFNGKPLTTYYLALPRQSGGAYVISTISIGSEAPAKEAAANLQSAVFKITPRSKF